MHIVVILYSTLLIVACSRGSGGEAAHKAIPTTLPPVVSQLPMPTTPVTTPTPTNSTLLTTTKETTTEPTTTPTPTTPTTEPTPTTPTPPTPTPPTPTTTPSTPTPPTPLIEATYYATPPKGGKLAKIVISRYAAVDDNFRLDIEFTALRNITARWKGELYVLDNRFAHHDDWKMTKKETNGHVRSSYYYITKEGGREYFKIVLQDMEKGDHFTHSYSMPTSLITALSTSFDVHLKTSTRLTAPLRFLDDEGNGAAASIFPSD